MLASNKKGEGQLSDMLHRNSWKRQAPATWLSAVPLLQLRKIRDVSASCLSVRVAGSHAILELLSLLIWLIGPQIEH